jgi:hypothetical protein
VVAATFIAFVLFLVIGRHGKTSMKYTWYSKAKEIFGAKGQAVS